MAADRTRIAELLGDPSLSCRAIARETGYSDWTIRKIARELDGDSRPMKQRGQRPQEPREELSELTGWLVFGGVVAFVALAIWAGVRWAPLSESPESPDSSTHPFDYRKENDET